MTILTPNSEGKIIFVGPGHTHEDKIKMHPKKYPFKYPLKA
jgi:hypothetical protein